MKLASKLNYFRTLELQNCVKLINLTPVLMMIFSCTYPVSIFALNNGKAAQIGTKIIVQSIKAPRQLPICYVNP